MKLFDTQRRPLLERLFAGHHDILAALRSLRRSPAFVAIAVVSLGLAIGLNTTTFAMLDAIRHPHLPYQHPEDLYTAGISAYTRDGSDVQHEMYLALRGRDDLFSMVAPWSASSSAIEVNGALYRGTVQTVSTEMFTLLGVRPALGRFFVPGRDDPADVGAAVIGYETWRDLYATNPRLDQLRLTVDDRSYSIIGVAPLAMNYPRGGHVAVWLPMPKAIERTGVGLSQPQALVRLNPGDAPDAVRAKLKVLKGSFAALHKGRGGVFDFRLDGVQDDSPSYRGLHTAVAGTSLLVLLVACLNLANLMLARGLARRREIAVRMAVGASGGAIMRYVFTECAVLALAGGSWGVLLSLWGIKLAERNMPVKLIDFGFIAPQLSWRTVIFGVLVTAGTVVVSGFVPALRARRADVNDAMKDGNAGVTGRQSRTYKLLAIGEVALALMTLMGGGLLLRATRERMFIRYWGEDAHVMTSAVTQPKGACQASDTTSPFLANLAASARAASGIRYATASMTGVTRRSLVTSDEQGVKPREMVLGSYVTTTPEYNRTRDLRVVAGRDFEPGDLATGAAIVNRATAVFLWPNESPVGHLLKMGPSRSPAPWVRVVGIVARVNPLIDDSTWQGVKEVTVVRNAGCARFSTVTVRTADDDPRTITALYYAMHSFSPGAVVTIPEYSDTRWRSELATRRLIAFIFTALGLFAVALAAVGVYGVLNYAVGQRMREFAMRIALGAVTRDVYRIVMHDALIIVLAGTGIGAFGAMWFGAFFNGMLVGGIYFTDVFALVGAELVIVSVSLAACLGPAVRASRVNPVDLMRAT